MARKKLEKVSHTLGSIFRARGLEGRLSEYRISGLWEETVGEVIAKHARPVSFHGKKLFLIVDSPAWMQQLSLLRPEIMEKVNRSLGKNAVREIGLNLGEVSSPAPSRPQPETTAVLSREDLATIESCVGAISNAEVRAAVRRVIEKDFLSRKAKQKK